MNSQYAEIVWMANVALVGLVAMLAAGGVIHSLAASARQRRRVPADLAMAEWLHALQGQPAPVVARQIAERGERVSTAQWIRIINRHETFVPASVWPLLERYLLTQPHTAAIERQARSGLGKWRRIEAMSCLGHFRAPSALALLAGALEEKDEDLRYFAMLSLAHMRTAEAAGVLLDQLRRDPFSGHKVVALLEEFPPEVLPTVQAALKEGDAQTRFWLLKLLARFKVAADLSAVAGFTRDASPDVRAAACECLGSVRAPEAREPLTACLRDPVWYVRLQAVRALARIEGPACVPKLAAMLAGEPSLPVQESIKNVMVGDPDAVLAETERFLERDEQTVKEWCVNALVDSNTVGKLLALCVSGQADARDPARRVLRKLIESKIHFGLRQALDQLQAGARRRVLEFVAGVDAALARRMESPAGEGA